MDKEILDLILERIRTVEAKVDRLLEFKFKVIGGTILASLVLTGIFQFILALVQRGH